MRMTFALAALFAATAITPALAQDIANHGDDRGGRAERGGGRGDGGMRQERPQGGGGWQRGQQAAPAPQAQPRFQAPQQPQPQQQAQQRWNGNRGNADGGMSAQRNWDRGQQDGQRNWQRNDAGRAQFGGTPAAPPVVVNRDANRDANRDGRRWDGNRQDRGGWNGTFGNNGQAWQQQRRDDNWRNNNQGRNDAWRNQQRGYDNHWNGNNNYRPNQNWNGNRAWTRDWRRDQQYDWQRYRYSNRDLFRARPYYAPYGWNYGYQRFSIGIVLNSLLWDQQYWIDDPYDYRLPPAYGPYRWVRYYDDVLLVDIRTGRVVDVINDFFW